MTTDAPATAQLEAGVRAFVDATIAETARLAGAGPSSPEARRRIAEQARAPWRLGGPEMATIRERTIGPSGQQVRVRIYAPQAIGDRLSGALVYLHGGGWTMFSLDTHDRLMREYAARSGLAVIGVDYALSPEARFPIALEQVAGVLAWLAREGDAIGVDLQRLAVGGDSAGANLALAACLKLRDEGALSGLRGLLLNYGAFEVGVSAEAARAFGEVMLSAEEMAGFWRDYLRGPADACDPLACPMLADLSGLPPAFLAVAACDILAEQSVKLAARLQAAGSPARLEVYQGASHSFLEAVSVSTLADRAIEEASQWLRAVCALA
jgi:acetyl esterase